MSLVNSNIFSIKKGDDNKIITHNERLRIFHGSSNQIVAKYGKGKNKNDYGKAFYCTEDEHQAKLWAVSKNGSGYVYEYSLDVQGLSILKIDEDNVLLWIAILMSNRELSDLSDSGEVNLNLFIDKYLTVNVNDYDIIIGYRADDSYFRFATSFIEGTLTYEYLVKAIKLGNLGYQVAIKSEKAFNRLDLENSYFLESNELKSEYFKRDMMARNTYSDYARKVAYDRIRFKNKVRDVYSFLSEGDE